MYYCIYIQKVKQNNIHASYSFTFDTLKGVARFLYNAENNNKTCKGEPKKYNFHFFVDDLNDTHNKKDFPYTWQLSNKDAVVVIPGFGFGVQSKLEDWAEEFAIDYSEAVGEKPSTKLAPLPPIIHRRRPPNKHFNPDGQQNKKEIAHAIEAAVKKKKTTPDSTFILGEDADSDEDIGLVKSNDYEPR